MGVEFFACSNCGETYCDAGDYFYCDCGFHFCSDECGARQESEENEDESTCLFCRHDQVTDRQLLLYLFVKYGLNEDVITQECIEYLKNGK